MPSEALSGDISTSEVNEMLTHWDLGSVSDITPMTGGSRQSPKLKVVAQRGTFVLKRRHASRADIERVRFAHQVMLSAAAGGLPIALAQTARDGSTFQVRPHALYELFLFMTGERWQRLQPQAFEAGKALATLHRAALEMQWHGHVKASCFHGNLIVVEALRMAPGAIIAANADSDSAAVNALCLHLSDLYQQASQKVDELDFQNLDSQVVHGDWHPGNILFEGSRVSGVLDFDSARLEPSIVDIANGLLQYSVRAGPSRAIDQWPHALDENLFSSFAQGFSSVDSYSLRKFVNMVPWLMIEACVAEASIPIAKFGKFATIPGQHMLAMIQRRAAWIASNATALSQHLAKSVDS